MTTIQTQTSFSAQASFTSSTGNGQLMLASGVMARYANSFGAGDYAFARMPDMWSIAARAFDRLEPAAQWTASTGAQGTASIDLGEGYTLQLDEKNSEVVIKNATTGETTRIWGDPHVDVDGKRAFDFWGTTTFTLGNGVKITIDTEQWGGNPNAYVASGLTITRGDQAIEVKGLSQNALGDLSVSMSQNGRALDARVDDGFVLNENATGAGWRSSYTGEVATQADLNATRPGAAFGPDAQGQSTVRAETLASLSAILGQFLAHGVFDGWANIQTADIDRDVHVPHPLPRAREIHV